MKTDTWRSPYVSGALHEYASPIYELTLREESSQTNVILQYKLLAANFECSL